MNTLQPDEPINRANPTNTWNTEVIEFDPGVIDATDAKKLSTPAWLKVILNGEIVYRSALSLGGPIQYLDRPRPAGINITGTGSRANFDDPGLPPLVSGAIFLQSHWGSQVEFRNPVLEKVPINRS